MAAVVTMMTLVIMEMIMIFMNTPKPYQAYNNPATTMMLIVMMEISQS